MQKTNAGGAKPRPVQDDRGEASGSRQFRLWQPRRFAGGDDLSREARALAYSIAGMFSRR